ncbi:efflux RND transporter periplasmic adaptor subunit [Aurantimonas coralicida]|uniref:efflux RND transporter periplasmic adaptor subunit n=1 Tax=Aurantimonas coralicida TaxID=182270 RepID=UPI001E5153F1|nr:efflux RND transporter periplasmic adaptor subunit [Aurantimonas coralicida]MCD1645434.1 efflux RND transporter periplasmic adaptor subunit [Aurantimonas coralicida]
MMRTAIFSFSLTLVAVAAGIGGYWAGQTGVTVALVQHTLGLLSSTPVPSDWAAATEMPATTSSISLDPRHVLYWRDPDGRPIYSATPRKTEDGRDFAPVHDDVAGATPQAAVATDDAAASAKRIRFYRNPMGLPDTSPVPKKDSMGMDYIPVYDGPEEELGVVTVSPGRLQRTGVRSELVSRRIVGRPLRVPGVVKLDERMISVVTTRADAFVEEVSDVTTGSAVRRGQPLVRLYSPEMATAGAQFVIELKSGGAARSGGAGLKLRNLGVPEAAIAEMERTGKVPPSMTWTAPRDGLVLERAAVEGMMTEAGDVLFRLADVSHVWVIADIPERELGSLRLGSTAKITFRGLPGRTFDGRVDLVYPQVTPETRTVKVRIGIENLDGLLLPDMYAGVEIESGAGGAVVAVPNDAILDTGSRQVVILDRGQGRFEPRPVELGVRGTDLTEVAKGIEEGDRVVTGANFLIDAESNIKAALSALDPKTDAPAPAAEARP